MVAVKFVEGFIIIVVETLSAVARTQVASNRNR